MIQISCESRDATERRELLTHRFNGEVLQTTDFSLKSSDKYYTGLQIDRIHYFQVPAKGKRPTAKDFHLSFPFTGKKPQFTVFSFISADVDLTFGL
ncbi:MAG: hypothetical protein AB8F74_02785 [Saprospiraceae bacterium]